MKAPHLLTAACLTGASIASSGAHAQSSVTLYGIADTSIRYITNVTSDNKSQVVMANGAVTNSRWGLKGTEDLGNGLQAIFRLEGGINLQDGTTSNSSRLFNRHAYVGVNSPYGSVTLGRQANVLFDLLGNKFDPLTVGNYNQNAWLPYALGAGLTSDNVIKYAGTFGGLSVAAMYSFGTNFTSTGPNGFSGEIPGKMSAGTQYGFTAAYATGPVSLAVGALQTRDNSNNKQTTLNADFIYAFSDVSLFLGYLYSKDDTGFVDTALAARNFVFGTDVMKGSGRKDSAPFAGVNWHLTPALTITGAAYYDFVSNAATGGGAVGDGRRYTLVGLAEYALSKRTQVYGTVDYNHVSGAASVQLPGRGNQTGVSVGMRHIF